MQETWIQPLGWEDPLEKGMATHSNVLVWRIPWTEEPGRLQFIGCKELDMTEQLSHTLGNFLVAQRVKNLPAIQETWGRSLGWEDPLEKGMATHSSILAWRIPWTEEPGGLQSMGFSKSWTQLGD